MSDKPEDDKWAGKGFGQRNSESAPEPEDDPDNEEWAWK